MPVGGKAGIFGVVEDGDGYGFIVHHATQVAPASTRAPRLVALFSFAREISAVHSGVVELGDGCGTPVSVRIDLGLLRRNFQSANDAHTQHSILGVGKRDLLEGGENGNAIDASERWSAAKDELREFVKDRPIAGCDPICFNSKIGL